MNGIIQFKVPAIILAGNIQEELGSMPKPFEREIFLGKKSLLQKFYYGGKPSDLGISNGSLLTLRRNISVSECDSYNDNVIVEFEEAGFKASFHSTAVAALIDAGFVLSGRFIRDYLSRDILPDLNVAYFRHIYIEIYMKD